MVRVRCLRCGSGGVTEAYDVCSCWKCRGAVEVKAYSGLLIIESEREESGLWWMARRFFRRIVG